MKKILLITLASSFIIACNSENGGNANAITPEDNVTELECGTTKNCTKEEALKERLVLEYNLPPEPNPEVNNATINGVDTNNNLIRDDWERAIVFAYHDDKINMNLHNALAKNTTLLNNYYENMNIDEYAKAAREDQYILDCAGYFYGMKMFNNIDLFKKSEDTKERLDFTLRRDSEMMKYTEFLLHGTPDSKLEAICEKYQ